MCEQNKHTHLSRMSLVAAISMPAWLSVDCVCSNGSLGMRYCTKNDLHTNTQSVTGLAKCSCNPLSSTR